MGGDLAVIKTAEENDFVYKLVMKKKNVPEMKAWIGLKKHTTDSKWYWVDGHSQSWGEGEANNLVGNENCAHFFGQPGKWNDAPCETKGAWIP